jgi:hypothetical protein
MTQPIRPPALLSAQLPSPELPGPGEPDELTAPRAVRLPAIPRPPPRLPKLPRGTTEQSPEAMATAERTPLPDPVTQSGGLPALYARLPPSPESAQLPAVDLDLASSRVRTRGTPRTSLAPGEQIRALVFAPDQNRAAWIDRELSNGPITVQVGRTARMVVAALTRDPPPRPDVLVIDFDAIAPVDLVELHALRPGGWFGRLIGLGHVPPELCTTLGVDQVLATPLVRDSLLDCVAGTRHAAVTTACPVIPGSSDRS